MKLAQTNLSKPRRGDIFVENRWNQDSKLRRSGKFHRCADDAAPTELNNPWLTLTTKMSPLRGWANFPQPFRLLRTADEASADTREGACGPLNENFPIASAAGFKSKKMNLTQTIGNLGSAPVSGAGEAVSGSRT